MRHHFYKGFFIVFALLLIIPACSKTNEEFINDIVAKMKPSLPKKFDNHVSGIDVKAGQNELIYIYEMREVNLNQSDMDAMVPKMKSLVITYLKNQKDSEDLFKRGILFRFICNNENGDELLNFTITREEVGY